MAYKKQWVKSPNYTPASQARAIYGRARTIDFGAGHWWGLVEAGYSHAGVVNTFLNAARQASAHAVVSKALVTEMVKEADIAWATNNANPFTVAIEVDPRIMYKWTSSGTKKKLGEDIFETLAEYIADKKWHNLSWKPHKTWWATACNPIKWAEVMKRAKAIRAIKDGVAPAPKPPAKATLEWVKLKSPVVMETLRNPTKLWNFDQTSWGGFGDGVASYAKGKRFTIYGKGVNKTLGATYYVQQADFEAKRARGFNQADLEVYEAPPAKPEWERNLETIKPVKLMVLKTQTEVVDLTTLKPIKTLGQGTWVDFEQRTTVSGKKFLISRYSTENVMPHGIPEGDVGLPEPEPPIDDKPEWLKNWSDIEDAIMYTRADAPLVDLLNGDTIKTIPRGTKVEIASATTWHGKEYLITKYSTDKKIGNGIALIDLDMEPPKSDEDIEPEVPADEVIRENNGLLKSILELLTKLINFLTGRGE